MPKYVKIEPDAADDKLDYVESYDPDSGKFGGKSSTDKGSSYGGSGKSSTDKGSSYGGSGKSGGKPISVSKMGDQPSATELWRMEMLQKAYNDPTRPLEERLEAYRSYRAEVLGWKDLDSVEEGRDLDLIRDAIDELHDVRDGAALGAQTSSASSFPIATGAFPPATCPIF